MKLPMEQREEPGHEPIKVSTVVPASLTLPIAQTSAIKVSLKQQQKAEQKSTGSTPQERADKRLNTCSRAFRGRVRKLVAKGNAKAEVRAATFGTRGSTSISKTYRFKKHAYGQRNAVSLS